MKLERRGSLPNETPEQPEKPCNICEERDERSLWKKQVGVILYIVILFAVALGLIVLSYLAQHRRNADTIESLTEQHNEVTIHALQNIEELQNSNQKLRDQVEGLKDDLEHAQSDLQKETEKAAAVERLFRLYRAVHGDGELNVQVCLQDMNGYTQYLDGELQRLYQSLLKEIEGAN